MNTQDKVKEMATPKLYVITKKRIWKFGYQRPLVFMCKGVKNDPVWYQLGVLQYNGGKLYLFSMKKAKAKIKELELKDERYYYTIEPNPNTNLRIEYKVLV